MFLRYSVTHRSTHTLISGTFANQTGQTACLNCAEGSYSTGGATGCSPCNPGTASSATAAQACSSCLAGSFSAVSGATSCTLCAPGMFQATVGSTSCIQCASNQYAPQRGSVSCVVCLSGIVFANFTQCGTVSCPAGTQASSGVGNCKPCAIGLFSAANSACEPCAASTYSSVQGSSSCTVCDDAGLSWFVLHVFISLTVAWLQP